MSYSSQEYAPRVLLRTHIRDICTVITDISHLRGTCAPERKSHNSAKSLMLKQHILNEGVVEMLEWDMF